MREGGGSHYSVYASSRLGQEMHPMNCFLQIQIIIKMLIHFTGSGTLCHSEIRILMF